MKSFNRKSVGRPKLEEDQPELLNTIMDIVQMNSSADARRRSEILRSCTTLDDLWKELQNRGFNLSRSATYFRLHPYPRCFGGAGLTFASHTGVPRSKLAEAVVSILLFHH